MSREEYDHLQQLSSQIIGAAMEVHKALGPGLLESVYEDCLVIELESLGLDVKSQVDLPLCYKGKPTGKNYRIDILVDHKFIVELKAVEELKPLHEVQLITYMKLSNIHMGLLINFNVPLLREGIRRKINGYVYDS
ncbi:MAG: GxxExxY protein [Prevotella sp.]|nr:GxxExxY protein [Prevotella sp.]